jgi:hypothetical protein
VCFDWNILLIDLAGALNLMEVHLKINGQAGDLIIDVIKALLSFRAYSWEVA